jgi:hypothetical protein
MFEVFEVELVLNIQPERNKGEAINIAYLKLAQVSK